MFTIPAPPPLPCTATSQHVCLPRYTEAIPNVTVRSIYPELLIEPAGFIAGIVDQIASQVPQSERLVCSLFRINMDLVKGLMIHSADPHLWTRTLARLRGIGS